MKCKAFATVILVPVLIFSFPARQKTSTWQLSSPDGKIVVIIDNDSSLRYSILYDSRVIMSPSDIALYSDKVVIGRNSVVQSIKRKTIDEILSPEVPQKLSKIRNNANELTLNFRGGGCIILRAYNDGIAWRFATDVRENITILNETASYSTATGDSVWFPVMTDWPREDRFNTSFECVYRLYAAQDISADSLGPAPALIVKKSGLKIGIAESDVRDYPGMFISGDNEKPGVLKGVFPSLPSATEVEGELYQLKAVTKRHPFLAETKGPGTFPWRVLIVAPDDAVLLGNNLVWCLASPSELKETSWIKPGKAMDNWIIDGILYGVDFESGNNTDCYKYYIDFASKYGIEYIMVEPEWNSMRDILKPIPAMNMPVLFSYAREKNVGLWLWTEALALSRNMEAVLDSFQVWGASGLMVDFFNRNDQQTVNELEKIASAAARRRLMLMYHGIFPSSGFERTWPNVLTREAVLGSEYNKWSAWPTPEHNLSIAFIRGLSGPFDYEPLIMPNASKEAYRIIGSHPMTIGTRCADMAKYILYASPFQVIAGSPVDLAKDDKCIKFVAGLPTTWDETAVPAARVNEYAVVARRKGDRWYLGGMNNSVKRTVKISLSFMGEEKYEADLFVDGVNAHRYAGDYRIDRMMVTGNDTIELIFAPGGGCAGMFRRAGE